ncbi:MAG: CBS domain-containing protein [Deltaproteobacteria bacterium]|nr:CBS domain-containing protein [Deltaproteobacteria bacterium]
MAHHNSDKEVELSMKLASQCDLGILSGQFLCQTLETLDPQEPLICKDTDSISHVLSFLQDNSIGSVLIVDSQGKLSGIFTERDFLTKIFNCDFDLESTPVSEVMTASPESQFLSGTIAFALNLMAHGGFRHIPIVDQENYPIGIISVKDVVNYIVREMNRALDLD